MLPRSSCSFAQYIDFAILLQAHRIWTRQVVLQWVQRSGAQSDYIYACLSHCGNRNGSSTGPWLSFWRLSSVSNVVSQNAIDSASGFFGSICRRCMSEGTWGVVHIRASWWLCKHLWLVRMGAWSAIPSEGRPKRTWQQFGNRIVVFVQEKKGRSGMARAADTQCIFVWTMQKLTHLF